MLENAVEASRGALQTPDAEFIVDDTRERAVQRFVLHDAPAGYEPGVARGAVAALADQYVMVTIGYDQVDCHERCAANHVEKFNVAEHHGSGAL